MILRLYTYKTDYIEAIIQSYLTTYPEKRKYQFIGVDRKYRYVFTDGELNKVKKHYNEFIKNHKPKQQSLF